MVYQPCPDCGVLMHLFQETSFLDSETWYLCPGCGGLWSEAMITEQYRLNALFEDEDGENE